MGWCPRCGAQVSFIAWEEAVAVAAVTGETLRFWLDGGLLHCEEGAALICLASLLRQLHDFNQQGESQCR